MDLKLEEYSYDFISFLYIQTVSLIDITPIPETPAELETNGEYLEFLCTLGPFTNGMAQEHYEGIRHIFEDDPPLKLV